MATFVDRTGNGSQVNFTFDFPYLETTDINVTVDTVLQVVPSDYTFLNATTIQFVSAPDSGAAIRIFRDTDIEAKQATFATGASIRADDLNDNFDQILYSGQELRQSLVDAFLPDDAVETSMIVDGAVTSAKIADGTIVDADINASAAINLDKLADGTLKSNIKVDTNNIINDTIGNADISSTADIAVFKLNASGIAGQVIQTDSLGTTVEWTGSPSFPGTLDVGGISTFAGAIRIPDGIVGNPAVRFSSDVDTGMYLPAADTLGFTTDGSEGMRIDNNSRVLISRTDASIDGSNFGTRIGGGTGDEGRINTSRNVGSAGATFVAYGNAGEARIKGDGDLENSNNNYGALSDIKFKENIVDANSQWEDIKGIQFRNYNLKEETGWSTHTQLGVVAQELQQVSPGLVTESIHNEETGETALSVSYSVLYLKAAKALQEALLRIEDLEQRLNNAGI